MRRAVIFAIIVVSIAGITLRAPLLCIAQLSRNTNGGAIEGRVTLVGPVPEPKPIEVNVDESICGKTNKVEETLVVGSNKGIANAVVSIPDAPSDGESTHTGKVVLDQRGCRYEPHVVAFPVGSTLEVINSDGILHTFHTESKVNPPLNLAQPGFKRVLRVTFLKPEIVHVSCDQHNWMSAWLFISPNHYYSVTDSSGRYRIDNVPAGTYKVEVWHEKLGTQEKTVTVEAGKTVEVDFMMKSPLAGN